MTREWRIDHAHPKAFPATFIPRTPSLAVGSAYVMIHGSMPKRALIAVAVVEEETLVRSAFTAFITGLGPYKVILTTGHGAAFIGSPARCGAFSFQWLSPRSLQAIVMSSSTRFLGLP